MVGGTKRVSIAEYKALLNNSAKPAGRTGKYNNRHTVVNGKSFDSKMEANYYIELLGRWLACEIRYFLLQVNLGLAEHGKLVYRCDFVVVNIDGSIEYIDVKGKETKEFRLKKALVEPRYDIEIVLVKLVNNHLKKIPVNDDGSYTCLNQRDFQRYRLRVF